MYSTNLVHFYPTAAQLVSARPNTDCLAASNGVCTKRSKAQFELLLFENKVNINSQTWPLIHLTNLATFYSKILLLKWVMPVKANSFLLPIRFLKTLLILPYKTYGMLIRPCVWTVYHLFLLNLSPQANVINPRQPSLSDVCQARSGACTTGLEGVIYWRISRC